MNGTVQGSRLEEIGYYNPSQVGTLELQGNTRLDFLHRQTTNDIRLVSREHVITSVLTSPTGRILDVLYVFEALVGSMPVIRVITLPGMAPSTTAYLNQRIFFMDQVKVLDISSRFFHVDIIGQDLPSVIQKLAFRHLPEGNQLLTTQLTGQEIFIFKHHPHIGLGIRLIAPVELRKQIIATILETGTREINDDQHEILRVEVGIPAAQHELTAEFTPLEAGLHSAISDQKGCYTGQEVIARQMTYQRVTRQLVGLYLEAPVAPGTQLQVDGKPAGWITSFASSPRFGPIALAMVKQPYYQSGTRLSIPFDKDSITATVTNLPFFQKS